MWLLSITSYQRLLGFFFLEWHYKCISTKFLEKNVKCYKLSLVMQQINKQFIKKLNKQSSKKFNILIQILVDKYQTF
jgi:hypothetical protein